MKCIAPPFFLELFLYLQLPCCGLASTASSMCKFMLPSGNIDPWNVTFAWVIDTVPPTSCKAIPRLPCSDGGMTKARRCTVDIHGDGIVSVLYQFKESSPWNTSNGTVVEMMVSNDGVHLVHLKVCFLRPPHN